MPDTRVKITSVLNPVGPTNAHDRVWMLAEAGVDYAEEWPDFGQWPSAQGAQQEADRLNALSEQEWQEYVAALANR